MIRASLVTEPVCNHQFRQTTKATRENRVAFHWQVIVLAVSHAVMVALWTFIDACTSS